ncbi:MAG TPA: helix-turn-helix domain-containing protein [Mobilitalea sp.]|nr:helix-turn-helix domain-containing protein [Mobilitalea sp.]
METMYLRYFTEDVSYPFYIQYGFHDNDVFMHTHADFSELVIVLNGTAMHKVDNESYFIKKGDVFVISNNTAHGYVNTNDFRICNIMYHPENLLSSDYDIRKLAGFHALFVIEPYLTMERSFQSRLKLQLADFEQVSGIISSMVHEYDKKTDGWKTMLNAHFMMLVVLLSRTYSLPASNDKSDVINIAKSVSYMENNYTEDIAIEKLAAQSNISTRHFTRIFHATYQTTPGNYLLLLRMEHACRLLKNTSYSISEIAFQSGFNDSNYFSRQFRQHFNISPKVYRNQNKYKA